MFSLENVSFSFAKFEVMAKLLNFLRIHCTAIIIDFRKAERVSNTVTIHAINCVKSND